MQRIPPVSIHHVVEGEVKMKGKASSHGKSLQAKYSEKPCFYCHWVKQDYTVQSEGGRRWRTIDSGVQSTGFTLVDETGKIFVDLASGGVEPKLKLDFKTELRGFRYLEYRIDEGEDLTAYAMAVKREKGFVLRFDEQGFYTPELANPEELEVDYEFPESEAEMMIAIGKMGLASKAVFHMMGGVALLCLVCFFGCISFKIHRVMEYLSISSAFLFVSIFSLGMLMVVIDLRDGEERLRRTKESAKNEVGGILSRENFMANLLTGSDFEWDELPKRVESMRSPFRERVLGIREDYLASIQRTNLIQARFPEGWIALLLGMEQWPSQLGDEELPIEEVSIAQTPINPFFAWIGMGGSLFVSIFGIMNMLSTLKRKRIMENLPTSLSSGLTCGSAEVKGRVEPKADLALTSPLTSSKCVYYHYHVVEKRDSGKNKTLKSESRRVPFYCRDAEGVTEIQPPSNYSQWPTRVTEKEEGKLIHTEEILCEEEEVYVLGTAVLDKEKGDHFVLSKGDDPSFPFILSSSEEQASGCLRVGGVLSIFITQVAIIFIGLLAFGYVGSFSSSDFLLSAFLSPLFLSVVMSFFIYNDLVFLRNRVKRAWSFIEVSLKKRSDLIPVIEKMVRSHLSHERSTMETLSRLRAVVMGKNSYSPAEVDAAMKDETLLADRLNDLCESQPEVKGNQLVGDCMNRLTRLENEVALMGVSYNDGIERYREAKQRMPEVLIAKLFRFENFENIKFSMEVRKAPVFDFESKSMVDSPSKVLVPKNEAGKKFSQSGKRKPRREIYLFKDGRMDGPFTLDQIRKQLKQGALEKSDHACWDGKNWKTISEIPGLAKNRD